MQVTQLMQLFSHVGASHNPRPQTFHEFLNKHGLSHYGIMSKILRNTVKIFYNKGGCRETMFDKTKDISFLRGTLPHKCWPSKAKRLIALWYILSVCNFPAHFYKNGCPQIVSISIETIPASYNPISSKTYLQFFRPRRFLAHKKV